MNVGKEVFSVEARVSDWFIILLWTEKFTLAFLNILKLLRNTKYPRFRGRAKIGSFSPRTLSIKYSRKADFM